MLVKNYRKQTSDKRKKNIRYNRYGVLILAAALTAASLSGCGAIHSDQIKNTAGQVKDMSNPTSTKPGIQNQTPDVPYSDQIDTIVGNKDTWCYVVPDDAGEEFWYNESEYCYWVTDMDQNGYLEVISSSTTGNGCYFNNDYYEVSQDGKSLKKLATDDREDAPASDLWNLGEWEQGFYDRKTGTYHYPQWDHTHGSAVDTSDAQLDVVLADGKVTVDTIYYSESSRFEESEKKGSGYVTEYYAGAQVEKLGEVETPYDEEKGDFIDTSDQSSEYYKKFAQLYDQYYEGMEEFTVTSYSFRSIDEEEYYNSQKIAVVSEEILRQRVEESWNNFGIHMPDAEGPDNPFFPKTAVDDTEVKYQIDNLSLGKATMQIQKELQGNEGALYLVTCGNPQEVSNQEGLVSEKEEKKAVKKRLNKFRFYLWVTDTQIYYIPSFYCYTEEDSIEDLDNGKFFDEEGGEDQHQKTRLAFYNEIPKYARLVCQEEEMEDTLEEMVEGDHQWIEKQEGDIRCYRSYTSRGEGNDTSGILQLVWKRDVGLIGVRTAAHPAGGFSTIIWKEPYLEVEESDLSPATMKPTQKPISYIAENEKYALALPDAKQFGRELQDFIYWEYATEIDKDAHDGMTVLTNLEAGNCLDRKLKLHFYYYECDTSEMDEGWNWNFYDVVVTFPEESQMSYYTFRYMSKGLSRNYDYGYGVYAEDEEDEEDEEDDISSSELEQKAWFREKYTFFGETDLTISKNEAENYEVTSRFEEGEKEQILDAITRAIQKQYGKKEYKDQVVYVRDFLPGDSRLSGRVVDLDMTSKNDMPLYWIQSVIYYSDEKREKFEDIYWDEHYSTAYSGASQPNYNPTVKQLKEWAEEEKESVDVEKCVLAYQITNGELIDLKEKQNK